MSQTNLVTKSEADLVEILTQQVENALAIHEATGWNSVHGPLVAEQGNYYDNRGERVGTHTIKLTIDEADYFIPCRILVEGAPAGDLDGLRFEVPCTGRLNNYTCKCIDPKPRFGNIYGGDRISIELLVRGAVELTRYQGGSSDSGSTHAGGTVARAYEGLGVTTHNSDKLRNQFYIEVSEPPQKYFLNRATTTAERNRRASTDISYICTIVADPGAKVTLVTKTGDGKQGKNNKYNANTLHYTFPAIDLVSAVSSETVSFPAAAALQDDAAGWGEFIQINVLSTTVVESTEELDLTPPANLFVEQIATGSIILSFTDMSEDEEEWGVDVWTDDEWVDVAYTEAGTSGTGSTVEITVPAAVGVTHKYRVRAVHSEGDGEPSDEVEYTAIEIQPLAPSDLFIEYVDGEIVVTWVDNSSVEASFQLDRWDSGLSDWISEYATVGANVESYIDADVSTDTSYKFRIVAINDAGDSGFVESNEIYIDP
jgi:hypothetical protein